MQPALDIPAAITSHHMTSPTYTSTYAPPIGAIPTD